MRFLWLLSDVSYYILYHVLGYRRKVVRDNLKNAFPTYTEEALVDIEKKFYHHFCDLALETLKCLSISNRQIRKRFKVKNPEIFETYYKQNKSVILYTAHQGNWEWIAFLPLFVNHQLTAFYQPLNNGYFDEFVKLIRQRFGVLCIPSDRGYRTMMELERQNVLTINCIIGDQSPQKKSTKHWVNFLNQDTAFFIGADRIARKSDHVVIFPVYRKIGRSCYELEFRLLNDEAGKTEPNAIVNQYAEILQETIQKQPELWLWSHRRWKIKKPSKDNGIMS
ncbi:MAG: lysophospholipid acyltransferase family protein [Bacteroidia bacterium]|nr:lysophospholipid acyltransferase family protein [Bacteroidia bacterium]